MVSLDNIALALVSGLATGMLLFLAAAGLTLIFGVLDVLNFAHGSLYMLGAYFVYFLTQEGMLGSIPNSFFLALIIAPILVAAVGGLIERVIIRPIYSENHIYQLLLTYALVLVIDNGARILWGTDFRSVNVPQLLDFNVPLFGSNYPFYNIFIILVGIALAGTMWLLFERTRVGKVVRAASQDREIANALGINVPFLFTATFILGSLLAGIGGALAAPYQTIQPTLGETIIIDAFIIVVLGGLGSFSGAFVGAILIGVVDSLAFLFVPGLQPVIPFLLLALVLLTRPAGLFGTEVSA